MIPKSQYVVNLLVSRLIRNVEGCVVECGVWRGGMSAGIADVLGPTRDYFLFDSFEGLPAATDKDGEAALAWQRNTQGRNFFDNCKAESDFAMRAMMMSKGKSRFTLVKGWFDETVVGFDPKQPIALLRLDSDWYDSTIVCLRHLSKYLAPNAIIIVDDYYQWAGCSKAVHQFLAEEQLEWKIRSSNDLVCYLSRG